MVYLFPSVKKEGDIPRGLRCGNCALAETCALTIWFTYLVCFLGSGPRVGRLAAYAFSDTMPRIPLAIGLSVFLNIWCWIIFFVLCSSGLVRVMHGLILAHHGLVRDKDGVVYAHHGHVREYHGLIHAKDGIVREDHFLVHRDYFFVGRRFGMCWVCFFLVRVFIPIVHQYERYECAANH